MISAAIIVILVVGSLGVSAVSPSDYKSAGVFEQMGALMKTHGEGLVKERGVLEDDFQFSDYRIAWLP